VQRKHPAGYIGKQGVLIHVEQKVQFSFTPPFAYSMTSKYFENVVAIPFQGLLAFVLQVLSQICRSRGARSLECYQVDAPSMFSLNQATLQVSGCTVRPFLVGERLGKMI